LSRYKPLLSARRGGARHPSREHQHLCWRAGPGRCAHTCLWTMASTGRDPAGKI